jgi:hypothetical protein
VSVQPDALDGRRLAATFLGGHSRTLAQAILAALE